MPRRVSLPGADELFRTTGGSALTTRQAAEAAGPTGTNDTAGAAATAGPGAGAPGPAGAASGNGHTRAVPAPSTAPDAEPEHGAANSGPDGPGSAADGAGRPQPHQDNRAAEPRTVPAPAREPGVGPPPGPPRGAAPRRGRVQRRPSGRERHDEKITVYVSAEELMDLEHARLTLRGDFGLAVDRGRIVREAIAVVLADLEARGEASILVRRLRGGAGH